MSVFADTVAACDYRSHQLSRLGNRRREQVRKVARDTENATTNALAEGLTHLAEAIRELRQELGSIETKIKALSED